MTTTTLILDWSDWDGPQEGQVTLTRVSWRRDPDTLQTPWSRSVHVRGRAAVDVEGMAGEVLRVRWSPVGVSSRTDHVLVPDTPGPHLVHLLERVDPATLDPLPEGLPSAVDLVVRAEGLVARIESGEFSGEDGSDGVDGVGVVSITDTDGDGVATVRLTSGAESSLPLPRGPRGDQGEPGAQGPRGEPGEATPAPELVWTPITLTPPWAQYQPPTSWGVPEVCVRDGVVRLRGMVSGGTRGTSAEPIATLPEWAWPAQVKIGVCLANGSAMGFEVSRAGALCLRNSISSGWISLSSISYPL